MHDGNPPMPGRIGRGRLSWTLLSLAVTYTLVVMGPVWNARSSFSSLLDDPSVVAGGLPQPLTIGVALLGAAALVLVVSRLVRDVEQHPYGSIAPVLAVFSGLILSSVRAKLPFPEVSGAQLGIAALTLSLLGGALLSRREVAARVTGWALVALPAFALGLALTAARGESEPFSMFHNLDAPLRAYLVLLAISAFALGLLGQFAHLLVSQQQMTTNTYGEPMIRLAPSAPTPLGLRVPEYATRPAAQRTAGYDSPAAFAASYVPGTYAQGAYAQQYRPTLALDDPDLLALTRRRPLARLVWIAVALLATAGAAGYFFVMKPEQQRVAEQERARALRLAQVRTEQAAQPGLADKMSRYLKERQDERERAGSTPTVTPLEPRPVVAAEVAPPVQQLAVAPSTVEGPKVDRKHRHRRHHRERVEEARAEPRLESKAVKRETKVEAKPAKPAPKTQNERELDLDELLQKGLKGGGKNAGADDPILGL